MTKSYLQVYVHKIEWSIHTLKINGQFSLGAETVAIRLNFCFPQTDLIDVYLKTSIGSNAELLVTNL